MILVIGGTGKAGREIVTSLAATGAEARVVMRNRDKFSDIEKLGLQPIFADLADISSVATALHRRFCHQFVAGQVGALIG